jgi:hypothetical protein
MKKTSRRNFGKQLTGALVAVPLASIAVSESASGQRPARPRRQALDRNIFNEHDTPPPVMVGEGSLIVETTHAFGNSVPVGALRKRHYVADYSLYAIAHIKIVDGSGEMLYRNDKPREAEVRIVLDDGSEVKLGRVAEGFYLDLPNDKDLGSAQNQTSKRKKKYHPKKSSAHLVIAAIKIAENPTDASPLLFKITEGDLNSHLEESRIMVWLE